MTVANCYNCPVTSDVATLVHMSKAFITGQVIQVVTATIQFCDILFTFCFALLQNVMFIRKHKAVSDL